MGRRHALRESGGPLSRRRDKGKREDTGLSGRLSNGDDDEEILSDEEAFDRSDDEAVYGDVLRTIGRRNKKKEEVEQGGQQLFHEEDEAIGDNSSSDEGDNSSASDDDGNGGLIDFVDSLGSGTARSTGIENDLQILPETEFALPPSRETLASTLDGSGVSLEALIAPLQDETTFATISGRVKDLSASSQKIKPPTEPIVARRAERAVTYESARTEATKWVPAVQKERQAEVSDFRPKIDHLVSKPSTGALIDKFVPQPGTMEARVADLLSEVGGNDKEENGSVTVNAATTLEDEGLTRSDDDPEEAKHKLARLKSTRALLFYHERKRHQINKIKSKLYRKIRRKQRKNRVQEEGGNDDESRDFEGDEEKEEDLAIARARERATLRHSAMKLLKGHKGLRSARSRDISESVHIAKELQQKAQGTSEDEDSLSDNDTGSSDDDGFRDQKTLEAIGTNQDSDTAAALADTKGGLMSMEFMKRGIMKQQEMVKLERDKALNELDCLKNEEQQISSDGEGDNKKAIHNPVLDALDPIVMHPSSSADPTSSSSGNIVAIGSSSISSSHSQGLKGTKVDDNPWLGAQKIERCDDKVQIKKHRRKAAASGVGSKDVTLDPIDAALGALPNHQLSNLEVNSNTNGVVATCNENGLMKGGGDSVSKKRNIRKRKARAAAKSQKEETAQTQSGGVVNRNDEISHEELVRHAFATPDLEQAFRDMKADEVEWETEEELGKSNNKRNSRGKTSFNETAGWGSWTGLGAPAPRKPQSLVRAQEAKQKALMQAKKKRKDASLPTVMINGKRQKRSALLRVAQVPYPFTSCEQYERSMRWPIGPEWNTCQSVRALTKKSELTRGGAIIAPISTKVKEG